jgi:outer membrane protein assembly factor BamB
MGRRDRELLFVGIGNSVLALDSRDGTEVWRVKVGGMTFVNVFYDGTQLFASTKGEVFCLAPSDGAVLWHNKLKGLGSGLVTFASSRVPGASGQSATAQAMMHAAAQSAAS